MYVELTFTQCVVLAEVPSAWNSAFTQGLVAEVGHRLVTRDYRPQLPGFAENPAPYLAVKWIPPKWDWVDPLKDRKAEIEAIEAGLKSRSDVIESEGYDAEEVDRRIAADHAREDELGLKFGRPATARVEPAVEVQSEDRERRMQSEDNAA